MIKGLFLHNPNDLNAKIPGGVQLCTMEFLEVIKNVVDELHYFEVGYNKSLAFRILFKLNLDNYQSYDVNAYKQSLVSFIKLHKINHVFINKSELIKFSQIIKAECPEIKVIIMSHGNESGDLLNDLTSKIPRFKRVKKTLGKLKLGINLYTESFYRQRYIDLVCVMSEEEDLLEKWLGQNNTFYIPRTIPKVNMLVKKSINNIFGYVGTLSHHPNYVALLQLFEELNKLQEKPIIRIVGGPKEIGEEFAEKYPFVNYVGTLSEEEILSEVNTWSFFLNPIFNYSRGASMKLAKAISWEIPLITTKAGKRGYTVREGLLIVTQNDAISFAQEMFKLVNLSQPDYQKLIDNVIAAKNENPTALMIAQNLKKHLSGLS